MINFKTNQVVKIISTFGLLQESFKSVAIMKEMISKCVCRAS